MNQEEALNIIENSLLSMDSFPVSIRSFQGVDKEKYEKLKKAILFLIDYYKDKDSVPKKLALAFVDISNYFFVPNIPYSEEDHERFENYGIELTALASELFDFE
jgi:hypothetical protein